MPSFSGASAQGDPSQIIISTIILVVNEGMLDSDPDTVNVAVTAQLEGLFAPMAALVPEGDEPLLPEKAFKQKQPLPLKLQLFCGMQKLTDAEVSRPEIFGLTAVDEALLDLETVDLDQGESSDGGVQFRYSADGEWIYNLSTQSLTAGKISEFTIKMPDGLLYAARFALN